MTQTVNGATERTVIERISNRVHMQYLDGMRGASALFVVVYHLFSLLAGHPGQYHTPQYIISLTHRWVMSGEQAVCIFIVLSGYCLMLPVAKSSHEELSGGVKGFLMRRCRRILPPYYAALICASALFAFTPGLKAGLGLANDMFPAFTAGSVLSHLLLVQNLGLEWAQRIDGPMWSVATEWQIYLIFVFALLPLWRLKGPASTLLFALILGISPYAISRHEFQWACPHFLFLFALGMVGASVNFSKESPSRLVRTLQQTNIPWFGASAALFVIAWSLGLIGRITLSHIVATDILVGAATTSMIVGCCNLRREGRSNFLLLIFETRLLVIAGTFSYSLYLMHVPILLAVQAETIRDGASAIESRMALAASIVIAVLSSYLFFLVFERPFMATPPPRTETQAELAAIRSPAP